MSEKSQLKNLVLVAVIAVGLTVFATIALTEGDDLQSSVVGMADSSTYQAIQVDTGETYFGKIVDAKSEVIQIEDVFYFFDDNKTKLVKRGKEAHAPNDMLTINNEHVITAENLSVDSPVLKAILKYSANK